MMLYRLTLVLVVAVPSLVSGAMKISGPAAGWTERCKGPVCVVAEKQAEGLARLRVLSNYIKETMVLMESVVSTLDVEITDVVQELRSVVGRRCHSRGQSALISLVDQVTHDEEDENEEPILEGTLDSNEIIGNSDDPWPSVNTTQRLTSTLSSDVDTVLGSSTQTISHHTSHHPSSSHKIIHRPSGSLKTHRTSQHQSGSTYNSIDNTENTSQSSRISQSTSVVSYNTSVSQHQNSSENNLRTQSSSTTSSYVAPELPDHGGRGKSVAGQGHGAWKSSHSAGRGQGRGTDRGRGQHIRNQENFDQRNSKIRSSGCWGVPEGSPHYVPGLDSWCQQNCPQGYCPSTHCVCY